MKITWDEEPALSVNNIITDEFYSFPRGYPFTYRNVVRFVTAVIDGSINSKKFKLPDSKNPYIEVLKHVVKVESNKLSES